MAGRYLRDYQVTDEAKLLTSVDDSGDWYFNGKRIKYCEIRGFRDERTISLQVSLYLITDDGCTYQVTSTDNELPTKVIPRAYRNHVNQQLLEDIHNG